MEHSLSSLAFKGSIIEAITEAKQQKKLFLVYLSGENSESNLLEESIWTDYKVAESVSKYCVLLHIPEASADATNFSAIYPQKSAPCITAIGYSGVQVWQNEGFIEADVLASSLEKSWLSLHIQETFLASAIASGTSNTTKLEHGSSSTTNESEIIAEKELHKPVIKETDSKKSDEASLKSALPEKTEIKTVKESIEPENLDSSDKHVIASSETINEDVQVEKSGVSDTTIKSTDVHFNIKLPDNTSLQVKFSIWDTLGMVKDYVDNNKTTSFGSYDLATPYPRKVFDDQDLDRQLIELELSNRQALIVVLRNNSRTRSQTNVSNHVGSVSNEGYWAFMRRMLSYANPFSYLSGGPTQGNQQGPTPLRQNDVRGVRGPYTASTEASGSNSKKNTPAKWGSNIHTLKHDEEDARFNDKNAFWNGNSTQYGGGNDGKEE